MTEKMEVFEKTQNLYRHSQHATSYGWTMVAADAKYAAKLWLLLISGGFMQGQ
jgi:hypothetical protein